MYYLMMYTTQDNKWIVSITSQKSVYDRWQKDEKHRLKDCQIMCVDRVSILVNECE